MEYLYVDQQSLSDSTLPLPYMLDNWLVIQSNQMVILGLAMTMFATRLQGDILDGDMKIFEIDYTNVDINEALRSLFRSRYINYGAESGLQGNVNIHMKDVPFLVALKQCLDQVHGSSCETHNGIFIVEDMPDHPSEGDVLNRKLPAYDFRSVPVDEALKTIFAEACVRYRHMKIEPTLVGRKLREGTLRQDLEVLMPVAKCKANYTHGHFDLLPNSAELPLREILEKRVHGIDFIDVSAKDAFATFFKQIGAEYVLGSEIDARLTLNLRDVKFEDALDLLCQLTDTTYQLRGTVYQIERRSFQ